MSKDRLNPLEKDEILVRANKRYAEEKGIEDQRVVGAAIQNQRQRISDGQVVFFAPSDVLDALESGQPFDKSQLIALYPEDQEVLDNMIGASPFDKAKRKINEYKIRNRSSRKEKKD